MEGKNLRRNWPKKLEALFGNTLCLSCDTWWRLGNFWIWRFDKNPLNNRSCNCTNHFQSFVSRRWISLVMNKGSANLPTWGGCNEDSCLPQCWCFISFRWWHGRQLATATPGTWAFPSCCGRPKLHQPSRCLPGHNTCSVDHTGDGDMARATWVARVGSPRSEGSLRAWRIWRNLVKIHETWKTFLISPKPCRPASSQKKAFTIPSSSPSWILWWGTCAPRSLCVTWVSTPRRSTSMSLGWLEGILWEA